MLRRHSPLNWIAFVLLIALPLFLVGAQAVRADWLFSYPPNQVTVNSDKRNDVFYAGAPVYFTLSIANYGTYALQGTVRYDVRDYWGTVVAQGTVAAPTPTAFASLTVPVTQPGWYKLSLHQATSQAPWGDTIGGTMFVILRNDANFPAMPSNTLPGNSGVFDGDEVARGVTGMGPQRHPVTDASQPDQAIAQLDPSIALDKQYYTPFDPQRGRPLLIAFPNGVADSDAGKQSQNLAGLKQLVTHYHNDVKYWEPRNEPNYAYNGADYVNKELKPFYQTVKSVDPSCKVLGPGVVTIGPYGLSWIEDFLKAGGANYIDAFSFHAYNNVNGDLTLARESLDSLSALLTKYGVPNIEKWQTEQGYFAACYGVYEPRLQGRWTMLQMMVYEQYGIPKEHNHLWYDKSHGFWDFPAFWENEDGPYSFGSFDPAAPLMRVWSEELYGTNFAKAYDFGALGNKLYVGDMFTGSGKQVAAFVSAGRTDGKVTLNVSGGTSVHVVSAFGVAQDIPVTAGVVTLPVPELPVYVEMAAGQTIQVVPINYGPNLALTPGTIASASGTGLSPLDPSYPNDISKVINGVLENWYWSQGPGDHPWMDNTVGSPAWVQVTLPRPMPISHVVVYAGVPWQSDGSLLDYEMQYDQNGQWVTLEHVQEPTNVVTNFTSSTFTTVDSFYSDRCVFEHDFSPVTTSKIRLLVHDTTWGGGANQTVVQAGGQTGPHQITLREIEIYGDGTGQTAGPATTGKVRFYPRATCASRMLGGRFQGSIDGVNFADLYTVTSIPTEGQWTEATFAVDPTAYRYLRFLSPNGGWGNVSEIEFYSVLGGSATKLTGTPFGTAGSYNNAGATYDKAFDGDTTTCFDAPGPNGDFTGIDQGSRSQPTVSGVSISPSAVSVIGGQTQQFSAVVSGSGTPAQTVTWTASAGSVSATGLFTSPSAASSVQTVTVTATSTADNTKSATATVTVPSAATASASATFLGTDTSTQGNWKGVYGSDGYTLSQDASPNNPSLPSYAQVALTGNYNYTWNPSTTDTRALQKAAPGTADRLAACWYSDAGPGASFDVDVNLTDGQAHRVSLYCLDWDGRGRSDAITVKDAGTGAVLDTQTASGFGGGEYLTWTLKGHVTLHVVCANTSANFNAVLSALFFDTGTPAATGASASFLGTDTHTQGSWKGVYGTDGYTLSQDTSPNNPSLPAYAQVALTGNYNYIWNPSTADTRALQKAAPGTTDRLAACWYSDAGPGASFDVDLNLTDGQAHRVSLYCLDWDGRGRSDAITVKDAGTGAVLDTQTASGFGGGEYLTWTLKGHVTLHVVCANTSANFNAVLSALFFDTGTGTPKGTKVTGVSVSPSTSMVGGGQTQAFTAGVSGTGNPAQTVTWSASAGTIDGSGLFTAPASTSSAQTVTVTATSTVDATQSGSAIVTVPAVIGGALKIGFLGDSITYGIGDNGGPGCYDWALTYLSQNGYQVSGVNYGNNGASVASFYLQTAGPIQAFEQANVNVVSIMLGTNDATLLQTSPSDYHDKLLWIVNSFLTPGTGIQKVILNYSPYIQPSSPLWNASLNGRLQAYQAQIDALCNGTTILQGDKLAFSFFQQHPEQGDGIHPNPQGHQDLGKLWAIGITHALGGTNTLVGPP